MIVRAIFAMTAASMLVAAESPKSEVPFGSRITRVAPAEIASSRLSQEDRGRLSLANYAACTFGRSAERVSEVLMLEPGKDAQALAKLAHASCLSGGMLKFSSELSRGALFGEMYRRRIAVGEANWKWPVPPIDLSLVPPISDNDGRQNYFMMAMADCLHAKSRDSVRAAVTEQIGSDTEKAAFSSVIAQLGPCVPQGVTLKLNRTVLKAVLGEYLYRSIAPVVPAPNPGAGN